MVLNVINFLVLALLCVSVVENRIVKEEKLEEISEVFNEIEKNQQKLKSEFEAILTEEEQLALKEEQLEHKEEELERKEEEMNKRALTRSIGTGSLAIKKEIPECNCVPYHLCSPETGTQITDGIYLVESRTNLCESPIEICCKKITSAPENRMLTPSTRKCGYSYLGDTTPNSSSVNNPLSTSPGEFPWTIMVTKSKAYACVGSLIHPKVVLTAAHCVNTSTDFSVRAGEWNAGSKTEPFKHQDRNVVDIIVHPEFRLDNLIYDAALLILDEDFELQENINTICLTKAAPLLVAASRKYVATGWGVDKQNGAYNKIMKKIEFSLEDDNKCQNCLRKTRLGDQFLLHESFICARGLHGSDTCMGNGGAPLISSIVQQPNRYQQIGIVSWGISCADRNLPTVFTKIAQIRDWVDASFDLLGYSKDFYIE